VHTLLEISAHGAMTAAQLVQILGLEKSSVSRMVSRRLAVTVTGKTRWCRCSL
jgi:predicted transcriptional regulator